MPLTKEKAVAQAKVAYDFHQTERAKMDRVRRYWKGLQPLPAIIPSSVPQQVRDMARIARVNICDIVVSTLAQSMFVDGFRGSGDEENDASWAVWQKNKMDARQTGLHRAAFAYGFSYAAVLPGDPVPVIRRSSPRSMLALYGEDPDWPIWALERADGRGHWRLYDEEAIYFLGLNNRREFEYIDTKSHDAGVTPVVRYSDEDDLDWDDEVEPDRPLFGGGSRLALGQVSPLFPLQDQIDVTTFGLLVAQHYSAFKQRYILGWVAENEKEKMAAGAANVFTLEHSVDDEGNDIKVGEWSQTDLKGYIESRDATLRHAAALSQTPVHELTGTLINMAAEALAAAEAGKDRKVDERQTLNGESHEQLFWLCGRYMGHEVPDDAQVSWRETSAQAFAATVDGLGKLVTMLGIPPQELWDRVPGATQQDISRWKAAAERGDSFAVLTDLLERQADNGGSEPALV